MGSGSKNRTTETSQATTVQTPTFTVPGQQQAYGNLVSRYNDLLGMDPTSFTTGATANQNAAFGRAAQGTGDPTAEGMNATRGLLGTSVSAAGPRTIAGPDANDYQASELNGADLSGYMNPYTSGVIDSSLNDLNNARMRTINNTNAGTGRGAWNGSRQGVSDSLTNESYLQTASSLASGLRQAGFQNAQQGAMFDIGNRNTMQSSLAAERMRAQLANQQGEQFADSNNLNAQQFNSTFQSQLAQQLASMGLAGAANTRADTELQGRLGAEERDINMDTNPNVALINLLQTVNSGLSGVPIGQTSNSNGTSTSTTSSNPGILGALGTLTGGLGALGFNPFSSKKLPKGS